jgi:protein ImuB
MAEAGADLFSARAVPDDAPDPHSPPAPASEAPPPQAASSAVPQALWLCIHLPRLALEVHTRLATSGSPFAVIDPEDRLRRVVACDERCAVLGIRPGLGLSVALALAPDLTAIACDARRNERALARLAAWAGQYTPRVSLAPPDALLLEVRGSLALFGGIEGLNDHVRAGLSTLGYSAQLALAPTPFAASWLARAGDPDPVTATHALAGALGRLPLACLRWPEDVQRSLQGMGVRVVADCLRLPRDGFARRFGACRLAELDRALGRRPDPRPAFTPPARFSTLIELPFAAETLTPLQHALARLLEELCGFLRARDGGVQALSLALVHAARAPTPVRLDLARPTRSSAHLLDLCGTRLERVTLPEPVIALRLATGPVLAVEAHTPALLADRVSAAASWPELLERLRSRLGANAVHGLGPVAEHRPEAAWRVVEPGARAASVEGRERPLWLLAAARPLDFAGGKVLLDGRRLELMRGPERIESGWWDGADVTRDYYVARDPRGARFWIYRERVGARSWFLQGVFG